MNTSLELSKRLYEKGLRIETKKWWIPDIVCNEVNWRVDRYNSNCVEYFEDSRYIKYPAPSTDELLAVMPVVINNRFLTIKKTLDKNYIVEYPNNYLDERTIRTIDIILSDALGLMCEYLLSNGYHYDQEKKGMVR